MRLLVLRLRALQARLHWLSTALGVAGRVADIFGLLWLVTLLNGLVLLVLVLLVVVDIALRYLLKQLRKIHRVLWLRLLDIVDVLRQMFSLHLMLALCFLFSNDEYSIGQKLPKDIIHNSKKDLTSC